MVMWKWGKREAEIGRAVKRFNVGIVQQFIDSVVQ
jgi:hypothetical protein